MLDVGPQMSLGLEVAIFCYLSLKMVITRKRLAIRKSMTATAVKLVLNSVPTNSKRFLSLAAYYH